MLFCNNAEANYIEKKLFFETTVDLEFNFEGKTVTSWIDKKYLYATKKSSFYEALELLQSDYINFFMYSRFM